MKKIIYIFILLFSIQNFGQEKNIVLDSIYNINKELIGKGKYIESINTIDSLFNSKETNIPTSYKERFYTLKGIIYDQLFDFKTSQYFYNKVREINDNGNNFEASHLNLLYSYLKSNDLDKFDELISKAKNIIKRNSFKIHLYLLELKRLKKSSNYKSIYRKSKIAINKLKIIELDSLDKIDYPHFKNNHKFTFEYYNTIAAIELNIDNKKTKEILKKLIRYKYKGLSWEDESTLRIKTELHKYNYLFFKKTNTSKDSLDYYFSEFTKASEKEFDYLKMKQINSTSLIKKIIDKRNELDQTKLQIKIKKVKEKKTQFIVITTAVFIVLLISIYFQIKLRKISKSIQNKNNKVIKLNTNLDNAISKLDDSNNTLKTKNLEVKELLNSNEKRLFTKTMQLLTIKDKLKSTKKNLSKVIEYDDSTHLRELTSVKRDLSTIISENEIWEDFKLHFEQTRPGFYEKLKRTHPTLTINDLKHCSYIVTNLKTKDVANLINVSPRSVETTRYRIAKKINLDKDLKLYDYLSSF